ncbi:hypothetical protein CMUS01_13075 [Colletotrichum musicola]|uniref:Uncharacterized protein n=1 Tax=Colletotrichum musicola TaxID=2175873 RepID=A0A8H6MXZ8_9PEZI|nr:hypothetical protein CMUS01_13075 [Colletotrichum musicola]
MLKFGLAAGQTEPTRCCLLWTEGSLEGCIREYFDQEPKLESRGVRLPRSFNAWSIQSIGGIEIHFTDNLIDHLKFIEDAESKKILVFHHVSFLECHKTSVFPDGFLDETLRTLAIIFPESEFGSYGCFKSCRTPWLRKLCSKDSACKVDSRLGSCGTLRGVDRGIENFRFWRDRLVILKQEYDEATPRTLTQFWNDRRNRVVWWTFWLAVVVLALGIAGVAIGIIQCVLSGLQLAKP